MRYLPHNAADRAALLATIGAASTEDLFRDVPASAKLSGPIAGLPNAKSEIEVEAHISALAAKNLGTSRAISFLGAGAYRHHVPASVDALIQRGEFLTSYTPYQPEISQGTLQALFEFQSMVCALTGMEVANASMYDGSTATAEAIAMACRVTQRSHVVLSGALHPHYRDVALTHARWTGQSFESVYPDPLKAENLLEKITDTTACVVVQTPDFYGNLHDYTELAEACHAKGALLIVVFTEVVSLGLLTPPGAMGADIVVGEGQSLGNPLTFGGPHVGLFATREKYMRQMPGRLCGQTVDASGKRGWVLTLSTREQHIRREKATSNICTNSGLCALAFTIHLALLGETGFKQLAALNHAKACQLADKLGSKVLNTGFFNEFLVKTERKASGLVDDLAAKGILAGVPVSRFYPDTNVFDNLLLVSATELTTESDMTRLAEVLA
jgi:glycine dehydrogenase subunit 1